MGKKTSRFFNEKKLEGINLSCFFPLIQKHILNHPPGGENHQLFLSPVFLSPHYPSCFSPPPATTSSFCITPQPFYRTLPPSRHADSFLPTPSHPTNPPSPGPTDQILVDRGGEVVRHVVGEERHAPRQRPGRGLPYLSPPPPEVHPRTTGLGVQLFVFN